MEVLNGRSSRPTLKSYYGTRGDVSAVEENVEVRRAAGGGRGLQPITAIGSAPVGGRSMILARPETQVPSQEQASRRFGLSRPARQPFARDFCTSVTASKYSLFARLGFLLNSAVGRR